MPRKNHTECHLFLAVTLLITLCSPTACTYAQVVQRGVVKEYRGADEKVPLPGVSINVQNAASTMSDSTGTFTLQFRTLHPGDMVTVRNVEKMGYEIFNKEALEQWIISGRNDFSFTIVMCPVKRFKQMRDSYERAASANYEAQFQQEKARLAKRQQEGKITASQYEKGVQRATASLQQSRTQASAMAEKFTRIDISEVSTTEREVISMVQQGKIQQAVITAEQRGDMMHMAELYMLAGGAENMEKADSLLRRTAWNDTTLAQPMLKFADFAYMQADWSDARIAYATALRHVGNNLIQRAWAAHRLGISYIQLGDLDNARLQFDAAAADIDSMSRQSPDRWRTEQISVRLSMASLLVSDGQDTTARDLLHTLRDSCLAILARDSTLSDVRCQLVKVENNLGDIYTRQKDYSSAQRTLQAGLMRTQGLADCELERAGICNSLGELYNTTGHPVEAEKRFRQCERMLLPLMARNPQGVMPHLARCYYNLYRLCAVQEGRSAEAERYRRTAVIQYSILAERQPVAYRTTLDKINKKE